MLSNTLTALSKSITTRQVKVLSQLYGAVCDPQYLMTSQPTTTRNLSSEDEFRSQIMDRLRAIEQKKKVTGLTIELGTHLDLTSFVVEVNSQGIYHNIELGSHFTFMFLMGYHYFLYRNY